MNLLFGSFPNNLASNIVSFKETVISRVISEPKGLFGMLGILLILIAAIFAPHLAPYDPYTLNPPNRLLAPTLRHPMGTDVVGRDTLSRVIYGARITVMVAFPTVATALIVGGIVGMIAGYFSSLDTYIVIGLDIIKSFPPIILALALISLYGPGLVKLIFVIAFTWIPNYARVMRAQCQSVKNNDYAKASKATGASPLRIIFRHILPNTFPPLAILVAMDLPVVITYEAGLSFLGLGVRPPRASWGSLLSDGYDYIRVSPWLVVFAGLALAAATLSFTLFGETLRDKLDPRLKRERH